MYFGPTTHTIAIINSVSNSDFSFFNEPKRLFNQTTVKFEKTRRKPKNFERQLVLDNNKSDKTNIIGKMDLCINYLLIVLVFVGACSALDNKPKPGGRGRGSMWW